MNCPHCSTPLPESAKFCKNCGKSTEAEAAPQFKFCKNCGQRLAIEAAFCAECGTSLTTETAAPSAAGETEIPAEVAFAPKAESIPTPPPVQPPVYTSPVLPTPAAPRNKNTLLLVLVIVLSVLVVGCAGVIGYMMVTGSPDITVTEDGKPWGSPRGDEEDERKEKDNKKEKASKKTPAPVAVATESPWFFPSDSELLVVSDLAGKSKDEVAMIRNEIYARHGYIFNTEPYKSYFEAQPWYLPNPNFDEAQFNAIEKANKDFIVEYEIMMKWR